MRHEENRATSLNKPHNLPPGAGVRVEVTGPVATVVLDRRERLNALSEDMWRGVASAFHWIAEERSIRAVIVRGAGGAAFSAGADIGELGAVGNQGGQAGILEASASAISAVATLSCPSIAVVTGVCIGAGLDLAASCDIRIADEGARFSLTPARIGLVYPLDSTRRLINLVGFGMANQMLLAADDVSARRAMECGLVNEVLRTDQIEARAEELAARIAALSPSALQGMKAILTRLSMGDRVDTVKTAGAFADSCNSADFREGVEAFRQKRPAVFADLSERGPR